MLKLKKFKNFTLSCVGQGTEGEDPYGDNHRINILRLGIDLGMTLIDTAEVYGNGHSEEVVGRAIEGIREKVFISTKFSSEHSHYQDVKSSLEKSLRRLDTDYVDLYQAHWPNSAIPIEETMKALLELKAAGKIRHIGVSNFNINDFLVAQKLSNFQIESNQIEYNLFERSMGEQFFPYAKENDLMIIAYTPLRRSPKGEEILRNVAQKYQRSPAQIVLNWLFMQDNVVPIPKTLNPEHVKENALASEFCLEREDFENLSNAFRPRLLEVPVRLIRVSGSEKEKIYTTLNEAIENRFNLQPGIQEIAKDIKENKVLKPVQLVPSSDTSGKFVYDLVQGRLRYWAWVYVYGNNRPIHACIKE
ncbi:MAG: aldo/keto reductase [Candidatus Omnitrophota bacterium]